MVHFLKSTLSKFSIIKHVVLEYIEKKIRLKQLYRVFINCNLHVFSCNIFGPQFVDIVITH